MDWDHGQSKLGSELQYQALQWSEVLLLLQCLGGVWVLISRSKSKLPFISKGQRHCMEKRKKRKRKQRKKKKKENKWTWRTQVDRKSHLKCLREEILEIKRTISFRVICHIFLAEKLEERRRFWVQFNVLNFQVFCISKYNLSSFSSSEIKDIGSSI